MSTSPWAAEPAESLADQLWALAEEASRQATLARLALVPGAPPLSYNKRRALIRALAHSQAQMRAYRRAARMAHQHDTRSDHA
jgi:hypothetical protein